jgi:NitT/TauT family transport system ATP-binding protein
VPRSSIATSSASAFADSSATGLASSPAVCTLANDPKILLLDEPFGALDNQTRSLMQEMLLDIWERDRKTVLFVTHDIEEAIFLGSRVVVMSARPGRIKTDITVELPHPRPYTVKTSPQFVALKQRLVEEIRGEVLQVADVPPSLVGDHGTGRVHQ